MRLPYSDVRDIDFMAKCRWNGILDTEMSQGGDKPIGWNLPFSFDLFTADGTLLGRCCAWDDFALVGMIRANIQVGVKSGADVLQWAGQASA